jgi:hypothetical protein
MLVILQQAAARGQEAAQNVEVNMEGDQALEADLGAENSAPANNNGENSMGADIDASGFTAVTPANPDESIDAEFRPSSEE